MNHTTLYIKNMVCNRCIRVVREEMERAGYGVADIELGRVEILHEDEEIDRENIARVLEENGFELLEDKNKKLVDVVKTAIISKIHHGDIADEKIVWSEYLAEKTGHDYKYLSRLFSTLEGVTIEHYVILQKVEKVKELIVYNDLSLSEIAWKLGYSSVAHLSGQFKSITGMTPSAFKDLGVHHRQPLDSV
jgi:AraC-like DNA-binding protein